MAYNVRELVRGRPVEGDTALLTPSVWDQSCNCADMNLECLDLDLLLSDQTSPAGAEVDIRTLEATLMTSGDVTVPTNHVITASSQAMDKGACLQNLSGYGVPCALPVAQQGVEAFHTKQELHDVQQAYSEKAVPTAVPVTHTPLPEAEARAEEGGGDGGDGSGEGPTATETEDIPVEFHLSKADLTLTGKADFDPRKSKLKDEDLKPQPMLKKAKKVHVKDENKDTKYWNRREKNNMAAKRSRDARRARENQIVLRASFLEKENEALKETLAKLKAETLELKKVIGSSTADQEVQSLKEENFRLRLALQKMTDILKCLSKVSE